VDAAKKARIEKQRLARERRQKRVLDGAEDRILRVSTGESPISKAPAAATSSSEPVVTSASEPAAANTPEPSAPQSDTKEVVQEDSDAMLAAALAELEGEEPDVCESNPKEGLQETPDEAEPMTATAKTSAATTAAAEGERATFFEPKNMFNEGGKAVKKPSQEMSRTQSAPAKVADSAPKTEENYSSQASAEEISQAKAKAKIDREARIAKQAELRERRKQRQQPAAPEVAAQVGTSKLMRSKSTPEASKPLADRLSSKPPAGVAELQPPFLGWLGKLPSKAQVLPALLVIASAVLLGFCCESAPPLGHAVVLPPVLVLLLGKALLSLTALISFIGAASQSMRGVLGALKAMGGMGAAVTQMKAMQAIATAGGNGEEALGSLESQGGAEGLQHAMAAFNHLKVMYATMQETLSQCCLFLVMYCIVRQGFGYCFA